MPDKNDYAWCLPCGLLVLVLLIWWLMPAKKSACACQHQPVQLMDTSEGEAPMQNPEYNVQNEEDRDEIRTSILKANMASQGSGPSLISAEFDDNTGREMKVSPQLAGYLKTTATDQDIFDLAIMKRPKPPVNPEVTLDAARNGRV